MEVVNATSIQKYSIFQCILFSRQEGSSVSYFENSTMSITQIYELIFNYSSFKFSFSYLYIFWLLFLPCLVVDTGKVWFLVLYFKCWFSLVYNLTLLYIYCLIVILTFHVYTGLHKIPSVTWLFHHSSHFHIN